MDADKIILSKNIWTGNSQQSISGGVAIKDNKIVYVGFQSLDSFKGSHTEILDYGDKLVIPGIHDAHTHFLNAAVLNSGKIAVLYDTKSEQECVDRLIKLSEGDNLINGWLIGWGWYHLLWDNQTLPSKKSLDKAFPDTPVLVNSSDGHTVWTNSAGLKKLGITEDSKDPKGGFFDRDENGKLTGLLLEAANSWASGIVYKPDLNTAAAMIKNFAKVANSYGITAISDLSISAVPGSDLIFDDAYQKLLDSNDLTLRVNMFPTLQKGLKRGKEMRKKYTGSLLRISGLKQFFDGVSSTHTAYVSEPYSDADSLDDKGHLTTTVDDMRQMVFEATENHFSVRIHAIGDEAVTQALDIYQEAEKKYGKLPDVQYTIEHLENLKDSDIERLRDLNVIASCQPAHALIDTKGIENDLGPERIKMMWPFRQYLARGVRLAFGTDTPVVDINPYESIYNAVTRKPVTGGTAWQPQNSVSVTEALRAYTFGAYGPSCRQNELGSIEKGKLADIAVLDTNILNTTSDEILKTHSLMTMVDGKIVYTASKVGSHN
ncbi:amidohydrolase [Lentilactobacillus raoultii]|uniref:Amidohydrolase n=1 Tax=Lentilactobacillus raoultii TaxID=1987503 RepID=A0ABW3PX61_9LACO|nr:amidohydrolase [Lentilactobacillus raoultii]